MVKNDGLHITSGENNLDLRRHQIFFKIPSYFCFEKSHIGKTRKKTEYLVQI